MDEREIEEVDPVEVPDPPPELAERWYAEVVPTTNSPRLLDGMLWYLSGKGVRKAAAEVGLGPTTLRDCLTRHKLMHQGVRKVVSQHERIAQEAGAQLLDRLDHGEQLPAKDLAVIGGISTDKLLQHQRVERESGGQGMTALDRLAGAIADGNVELRLEVTQKTDRRLNADVVEVAGVTDPVTGGGLDVTPERAEKADPGREKRLNAQNRAASALKAEVEGR